MLHTYLWSFGVWAALSLLTGWQYHLFDRDWNIPIPLLDRIALAESRGLAFALLTPPLFWLVARNVARPVRSSGYLAYVIALGPFMIVEASIRWMMYRPFLAEVRRYVPRAGDGPLQLIRSGFADQITTYAAIIAAAHAYLYLERTRRQELEQTELQRALAASELQALKMQLHPHFLFNTLNGISTLIDSDRTCAKEMIVKLSTLLRLALDHRGAHLISLEEELKFVAEYLALETMRLGERLTVKWSIGRDTRDVFVPQLILQPIVENAILHGIGSSRERGWLDIDSSRSGGSIELRVRNSVGKNRSRGNGVGLRNTEARLRHFYGEEGALDFALSDDGTATTTLVFPALGSVDVDAGTGRAAEGEVAMLS